MTVRKSKKVMVGAVAVGGGSSVSVQSMLNAPADSIDENIRQALELQHAGCDIIRVAILDKNALGLVYALKNSVHPPIVADIHFDYRLAIECVEAGADKIRINPGNIGDKDRIKAVANACRQKGIPIRVGVNSGSLEPHLLKKYKAPTPEALCESALHSAALLERFDFTDIVLSIKASDVATTVQACELVAAQCNYPLHLGVTEAGTERMGIIKSSVAIGALLLRGIGDTIRVSLAAHPIKEVIAAKDILKACGRAKSGVNIIACPTCGRTKIDIIGIANELEKRLAGCKKSITVAVMGCAVNGPGEAKHADIGIAGGKDSAVIFKKGEILRKVSQDNVVDALIKEIDGWEDEK